MTGLSSAAYVTAVLQFLQAYNAGDLDTCERYLDEDVEWHSAAVFTGRSEVRQMLEAQLDRFSKPQVRPDDFRVAGGHVLMIVCLTEGDAEAVRADQRQSWLADINDAGQITRVVAYTTPAEAARALEALAPKVHA